MVSKLLIILVAMSLIGCATIKSTAESTDTFIVCKTADLATTYVGLNNGLTEANPIVAKLLTHGWLPVIALSVATYWLLEQLNDKTITTFANAVTCGAALNNSILLVK